MHATETTRQRMDASARLPAARRADAAGLVAVDYRRVLLEAQRVNDAPCCVGPGDRMIRRRALVPALALAPVAAQAQAQPARVGFLHPRLSALVEPLRLAAVREGLTEA